MVTYLYCVRSKGIADRPARLVGVAGVRVRTLSLDPAADLEAWVATLDRSAFRVTGRALAAQALVHNEVVSAALATGQTPLPARFGSHFPDDASCIRSLSGRAPQLRAALARLDGTVEMSVLIVSPRAARAVDPASLPMRGEENAGRRYLELVRERSRQLDGMQRAAEQALNDIRDAVREITRDESATGGATATASIAHLLRRDDTSRYREAVRAVRLPDDCRIIVAGPRAPYSFVRLGTLLIGHDSGSPSGNG
jgi:hypothetical protein